MVDHLRSFSGDPYFLVETALFDRSRFWSGPRFWISFVVVGLLRACHRCSQPAFSLKSSESPRDEIKGSLVTL